METIEAKVPLPPNTYLDLAGRRTHLRDEKGRVVYEHRSDKHPYYMTWDDLHGEIEIFSNTKPHEHLAVYDRDGNWKSGYVPGRYLEFLKG